MNYMNQNPFALNMGGTQQSFQQPTIADQPGAQMNPLTRFLPQPEVPQSGEDAQKAELLAKALQAGGRAVGGGGGGAPARGGPVTSAGYFGQGMDTGAIGNAIGKMF